jgi:hypothetical protein
MGKERFAERQCALMGNQGLVFLIWKRGDRTAMQKVLPAFPNMSGNTCKTREDIKSRFDALDLDDYVSFGGKA